MVVTYCPILSMWVWYYFRNAQFCACAHVCLYVLQNLGSQEDEGNMTSCLSFETTASIYRR